MPSIISSYCLKSPFLWNSGKVKLSIHSSGIFSSFTITCSVIGPAVSASFNKSLVPFHLLKCCFYLFLGIFNWIFHYFNLLHVITFSTFIWFFKILSPSLSPPSWFLHIHPLHKAFFTSILSFLICLPTLNMRLDLPSHQQLQIIKILHQLPNQFNTGTVC